MAKVSAETLAALQQLPREVVTVPILGAVTIQGMSGAQRDAFEASCIEERGKKRKFSTQNFRAKLVAFCAVDDDGERLFTDPEALGSIRADVLDRLYGPAARLSGLSKEDEEELGKSLATETPSRTSSSPSPLN